MVYLLLGKYIRQQFKDSKFKKIAPAWNEEFHLPKASYSVSDIRDYIEYT